jgi:serine/threonine-protein kinase ATR
MSIAGYILGLGDRHGENLNIDAISGDCVHVDFNCLFNKVSRPKNDFVDVIMPLSQGETFEFPEVVPFRLTHNMVEAMVRNFESIQSLYLLFV